MFPLTRNPWRTAVVLGGVLLLHLALWCLLGASAPPTVPPQAAVRVTVLLPPPPIPATPVAPAETPRSSAEPARSTPVSAVRKEAQAPPRAAPSSLAPAITEPMPTAEVAVSPPAQTASTAAPSLLDSAATRRAIRDAARQRPLSAMGDAPAGADRRLADSIADSAKGDCLKGEYVGGGMGLLSLPFWALAQLREQCSK